MSYKQKKFEERQKYIEELYKANRLNTNLTQSQHDMVQRLSDIRHKLHSAGWKVYAGKPLGKEIADFFATPESEFEKVGLPYPKAAMKAFATLETGGELMRLSNPSNEKIVESCRSFLYEKEFINDVLENWIADVDSQYGTNYAPKHATRNKDFSEYMERDIKNLKNALSKGQTLQDVMEAFCVNRNTIHNIEIPLSTGGVRDITGMYDNTPFSCCMSDNGKAIDIVVHTPGGDLEPSEEVAKAIESACANELKKVRDFSIKKSDKILLISMDNTLADLNGGLTDLNGRVHLSNLYEALEKPTFFKTLEPIEPMISAVKLFIHSHPEVDVFAYTTARPSEPPGVPRQKHDWLNRNIPEISPEKRLFVQPGTPKSCFISEHPGKECILIDADVRVLEDFEAHGGRAVRSGLSTDMHHAANNVFLDKSVREIYRELEKQVGVPHVELDVALKMSKNANISH